MKILYTIGALVAIIIIAAGAMSLSGDKTITDILIPQQEETTQDEYVDNTGDVVGGLPGTSINVGNSTEPTKLHEVEKYSYGTYNFSVTIPEDYTTDLYDNLAPRSIQIGIANILDKNQQLRIHIVESDYCLYGYCFLDAKETIRFPQMSWNYLGIEQYNDAGATGEVKHIYSNKFSNYVVYVTSNQKLHTMKGEALLSIFSSISIALNNTGGVSSSQKNDSTDFTAFAYDDLHELWGGYSVDVKLNGDVIGEYKKGSGAKTSFSGKVSVSDVQQLTKVLEENDFKEIDDIATSGKSDASAATFKVVYLDGSVHSVSQSVNERTNEFKAISEEFISIAEKIISAPSEE